MGYNVDEHAVNVFDSITGFVYTALWVIPNAVLFRPGPPPGAFRSRALRVSHSRSVLYGAFVFPRRA